MSHGCRFCRKMVEEDLVCLYVVKNGLAWYVKNDIEPLLVTVRASRTVTHEDTVHPKEFKKTKDEHRKSK